jgi:hypothetical protein
MNVCWHGPPSLKSKAVISRSYPHLSNFFFTKLGIAHAPPFALVDELRMIADRYRSRLVPQDVWEHVAQILADISDVIEEMPGIPRSFQVLADMPAFPVRGASEGIVLRPIDGFYIPDKASKYAGVFRERVPLLDFPESVPMSRIRPLLECDVLKDKLRYLDRHVTKRSVPQGKRVLDTKATELYSSKVEYIARYALLYCFCCPRGVILMRLWLLDSFSTIATSQTCLLKKPRYSPSYTISPLLASRRLPPHCQLTHA